MPLVSLQHFQTHRHEIDLAWAWPGLSSVVPPIDSVVPPGDKAPANGNSRAARAVHSHTPYIFKNVCMNVYLANSQPARALIP